MIKDHGVFSLYSPQSVRFAPSTIYCRNENGIDWYDIAHSKPIGRYFYIIHPETGKICGQDTDPERIWPLEHRIVETDFPVEEGRIWDGQAFVMPT